MPSREGERESEDHGLRDFLLLFIFLFIDEGKNRIVSVCCGSGLS